MGENRPTTSPEAAAGIAKPGARDRLIEAAMDLFCRVGIRAAGIDRILAEAGVAKMSLYKHFRGKDELVVAALERKDELFRETFLAMIGSRHSPRARLLGVFDALEKWFARPDFRGCLFLNAAAELSEPGCCGREAIAAHKAWVFGQLRDLAEAAGAADAEGLAGQLMLLFEGAISRAYVTGDVGAARDGKAAATVLLDCATAA